MKKPLLTLLALALAFTLFSCTESNQPSDTDGRVNAPNTDTPGTVDTTPSDTSKPVDTKPATPKPEDTSKDTEKAEDTKKPSTDIMDLDFKTVADMVAGMTDQDKVSTSSGLVFYDLTGMPEGFEEAGCKYDSSEAEYTINYRKGDQLITVTPMIEEKLKLKFENYAITKEFSVGSRDFKLSEGMDTEGVELLQIFVFDANESYFMTMNGIDADEETISKTELEKVKTAK